MPEVPGMGPSPLLNSDFNVDSRTGHFISEQHRLVAQLVQDYNPNLRVTWIPHGDRTAADKGKEFCIIHTMPDGSEYVVMYVAETHMDNRVLGRLYDMDSSHTDHEKRLHFLDMVAEAAKLRAEMNRREEAMDTVASVLKSPKHTYKMPSGRVIHK